MFFVTNRVFKQGNETSINRLVSFDLNDSNALQSVFFCRRPECPTLDSDQAPLYVEIGSEAFLDSLSQSEVGQILFYIHGYNNLPEEDIFPRALQLQKTLKEYKLDILVIPIIWPCDNDLGMIKDYFDDQVSADASATAFSRALSKFNAWRARSDRMEKPCLKRINVLAHSMGNRVLRGALLHWANQHSGNIGYIFRNIFMAAADVENETLHKGERGSFICQSSRNVVVYHASDDLALRSSKIVNLKSAIVSRRLGHTGPEDMRLTPDNVYAVDCDEVNTAYDSPKGHAYFCVDLSGKKAGNSARKEPAGGKVFEHIAQCLETGRAPCGADRRLIIK